ncbi:hypothetical protein JQX13_50640 [Archangium violaceum]|uniref:hypothetical protein n=1 Tax=Archangium violaceum TaxID=83451 RepID=UPI00193C0C86|nr:hypothetical protein [Archangium violaceum]QRK14245.1 hypothetical protein JQX13_50640 [Archangium violaceum]
MALAHVLLPGCSQSHLSERHFVEVTICRAARGRFSLLPADDASGNFVKVVQRIPVRITWVEPPRELQLPARSVDEPRTGASAPGRVSSGGPVRQCSLDSSSFRRP